LYYSDEIFSCYNGKNQTSGKEVKEIERKYLLKDSILSLIKRYTLKKHKITQYYTTITPLRGVRYREMDKRYFKTVKYGTGASREEEEVEVTKKKFKKHFNKRINEAIRKERYLFEFEGKEYSIDVFKKNLRGLYLLEVEFPDVETFELFELPKIFQMHVIKDVSFDEAYKNKNLVLKGRPDILSKTETILLELEKKNIDELDSFYTPNLTSIDALRVILYKFSLLILYYQRRILEHNDSEDLHQFRVYIRKSRAFLKEFAFLFPKNEYTYFYDTLSHFGTQTNHKRDLDVIKERLREVDSDHDIIQNDISTQQAYETQNIQQMLKSSQFENFFHTYQHSLRYETLLTSYNTVDTIEDTARKIIQKLHMHIIKKINALEKDFSDKKLHKIRISFKKLRYLLEEFQHIFGEEKIAHMIEKGKKLQNLLGDFNDTVNQRTLLHTYFKSQKGNIPNAKELERRLLKKTSKSQEDLLRQTRKKLHSFKQKAFEI
jgi:CHAD domain-containing protein/CYTH domain-containing protein